MTRPSAPLVATSVARPQRTLVLGCGSIGQAVVPLLIRDLAIDPKSIRVVEMADTRARIADSIDKRNFAPRLQHQVRRHLVAPVPAPG